MNENYIYGLQYELIYNKLTLMILQNEDKCVFEKASFSGKDHLDESISYRYD